MGQVFVGGGGYGLMQRGKLRVYGMGNMIWGVWGYFCGCCWGVLRSISLARWWSSARGLNWLCAEQKDFYIFIY